MRPQPKISCYLQRSSQKLVPMVGPEMTGTRKSFTGMPRLALHITRTKKMMSSTLYLQPSSCFFLLSVLLQCFCWSWEAPFLRDSPGAEG